MKKAYKGYKCYYVTDNSWAIKIGEDYIRPISIKDLTMIVILGNITECDLSEAVAAFDKVVKSLKDKMI